MPYLPHGCCKRRLAPAAWFQAGILVLGLVASRGWGQPSSPGAAVSAVLQPPGEKRDSARPTQVPAPAPVFSEQTPPQPTADPSIERANWNPGTDRPLGSLAPLPGAALAPGEADPAVAPWVTLPPEPAWPPWGNVPQNFFDFAANDRTNVRIDGLVRGFFRNDQRLQWSGLETTFGAEGIIRPLVETYCGGWRVSAEAEFFINQRFGSSILSDPVRDQFRANFDVQTFEIFQLYCQAAYDDFLVRIGKSRTPYGRFYAPMYTNALIDAPFLRSDIIAWAETGVFAGWHPLPFTIDVGLINGETDLDTNSSKGAIGRIGFDAPSWALGVSGKVHDGISSEQHKRFNNYYGADFAIKFQQFIVYGEVLYDEHGFRRDFFALGNPARLGARSAYGRDVFKALESPITGWGYYLAVGYRNDAWWVDLSYGSFYPEQIGLPIHDRTIDRFVGKVQYTLCRSLQYYLVGIVENDRPRFDPALTSRSSAVFTGLQFVF